MILVIAGLPGAGKSTVGKIIAKELNLFLYDVDDHLPVELRERMQNGIAVTDEDRLNYLKLAVNELASKDNAVFVTPLFLDSHANFLFNSLNGMKLIWLEAPYEVLFERVRRRNHFVNPVIFNELFNHKEEVHNIDQEFDATKSIQEVVEDVLSWFSLI